MIGLVYDAFATLQGDRIALQLTKRRLRILCYHGVCADDLAGAPWMPSSFVTQSALDGQLRYLQREATVLPLIEAVERLRDRTLPSRSVCITFDDGYANNLALALPLLRKYRMPATIFLTTTYVESGEWYPFLRAKLLRLARPDMPMPPYKICPLDEFLAATAADWERIEPKLTVQQRETLRPCTVGEVCAVEPGLVEFGAHSHTHAIPRNETLERRRAEVAVSLSRVTAWTGRVTRTYCYPNGEAGDFGEPEQQALREAGVVAAVSGIGGANDVSTDVLALKRYPLTLDHNDSRFRAEIAGLRSLLVATRRKAAR